MSTDKLIPDFAGASPRQRIDGSFFIPRPNREAERFYDQNFIRVPNELRWYPKTETPSPEILGPMFAGRTCYIVGKGPSLDKLTQADFAGSENPIIAINEAVLRIEDLRLPNLLLGIQQDASLKDTCRPRLAVMLLSPDARYFYANYPFKIVYNPIEYHLGLNALSVSCAIKIARSLGCFKFVLLAFDALKGNIDYAKSVGYTPDRGGDPRRFLEHRKSIERFLAGCEWVSR